MTRHIEISGGWRMAVVIVAALAVGSAVTYVWVRPAPDTGPPTPLSGERTPVPTAVPSTTSASPEIGPRVMLTPEAIRRAGITVAAVQATEGRARLRLPAVIEANGYAEVVVTPLVAGRLTRVAAELGQHVREGQVLAEVFSPELSEVQARYLTMRSEFDAAHERLQRTERLVEIGAASRQELERVRAEHTTHATDVETARARLRLLGATNEEIDALRTAPDLGATVAIRAPRTGAIVERQANVGLNVDLATRLFRIVDLSSVWVLAELHERDFGQVRIGSPAAVSTSDRPEAVMNGRVTYIDPQVRPETRTARLRIELPNPGGRLRLGMYADVVVGLDETTGLAVPRSAVQTVGGRQVVYVEDAAARGTFVERTVRLAEASGENLAVLSGLSGGERVVVQGSFYLRAEAERAGQIGTADPHAGHGGGAGGMAPAVPARPASQEATVTVGASFEPATVRLVPDVPARITFLRTTDATCATEVVFPAMKLRRALPLNQPVVVEIPARAAGEIGFACGMDMLKGTVVIAARNP